MNYYDPQLIAANQDFARRILTHVNPYTKRSYADEPGVGAVEITNENSLLGMWLDGSFLPNFPPAINSRYARTGTHGSKPNIRLTKLRAAWTELNNPLDPNDVLAQPYPPNIINPNAPDSRMEIGMNSMRRFKFKSDSGAAADVDLDPLGGPTINGFVRPGLSMLLKSIGNEKWGFHSTATASICRIASRIPCPSGRAPHLRAAFLSTSGAISSHTRFWASPVLPI